MNDNITPETTREPEPAGRIIRLIAAISDFFIFFLLLFMIYSPKKEQYFPSMFFIAACSIFFETVFNRTPVKFLLKLEVVYEKKNVIRRLLRAVFKYFLPLFSYLTILDHPRRQGWHDRIGRSRVFQRPLKRRLFKGLGFMVLSIYAWLLFGLNHAIEVNMNLKLQTRKAYIMPVDIDKLPNPEETPSIKTWINDVEFNLPLELDGRSLAGSFSTFFYSKPEMEPDDRTPEVFMYTSSTSHIASDISADGMPRLLRPLFKEAPTPVEVQDRVFFTDPRKRWLQWDPFARMRLGIMTGFKALQFFDLTEPSFLRRFVRDGLCIYWTAQLTDFVKEDIPRDPCKMDALYIADSKSYKAFFIKWTGVERREELIHSIMRSVRFRERGKIDIARVREQAVKRRSLIHAWELLRLTDMELDAAELLYGLILEKGLAWEKYYFARMVQNQAEKDYRYRELCFLTRDWPVKTAHFLTTTSIQRPAKIHKK